MAGHSGGEDEFPLIRQYGVLAYDIVEGELRLLLITSRETKRWVIPRGNPIFGLLPHHSAAQEAWEEAGVVGRLGATKIGAYRYEKRRRDGSTVPANVHVFPLHVTEQRSEWPEQGQRQTRWFTRDEAVAAVAEPGLKTLIQTFAPERAA